MQLRWHCTLRIVVGGDAAGTDLVDGRGEGSAVRAVLGGVVLGLVVDPFAAPEAGVLSILVVAFDFCAPATTLIELASAAVRSDSGVSCILYLGRFLRWQGLAFWPGLDVAGLFGHACSAGLEEWVYCSCQWTCLLVSIVLLLLPCVCVLVFSQV